jgi:hypothetical protein
MNTVPAIMISSDKIITMVMDGVTHTVVKVIQTT